MGNYIDELLKVKQYIEKTTHSSDKLELMQSKTLNRSSILPVTTGRDAAGGMSVAGHNLCDLARKFGTPLYVYDAETIRTKLNTLNALLQQHYPGESHVSYAAKAYFALEFARRLQAMGISLDVVSLGELEIAKRAGFGPGGVHLHGNNKSLQELDRAITWGVSAIVADSLEELDWIENRASVLDKIVPVWLRIAPGLLVDTHPYRQTGHSASKFGLPVQDGIARQGIRKALALPHLRLTGLHFHLGSQLFDPQPYRQGLEIIFDLAGECNFCPEVISPGGGWGVPYTQEDLESDPGLWIEMVGETIQQQCRQRNILLPRLVIEPGRWLVARAGLAIYTVGSQKTAGDGAHILSVDGGMADNPRPALYHAEYTALIAECPDATADQEMRVVGKYCESGDELIHAVKLPAVAHGDHLVMPVAGAYQLSMSSNYNLAGRPAVLWLEKDRVEVIQRRIEAFEDPWWVGDASV